MTDHNASQSALRISIGLFADQAIAKPVEGAVRREAAVATAGVGRNIAGAAAPAEHDLSARLIY